LQDCIGGISNLDYPRERITLCFIGEIPEDSKFRVPQGYNEVIIDIEDEKGKNIPHARNKGIEHFAKRQFCEYFFSVDVDVIVPKEALNVMLAEFETDRYEYFSKLALVCIPYGHDEAEMKIPLRKAEVNISMGCTLISRRAIAHIFFRLDERSDADDIHLDFRLQKLGFKTKVLDGIRCFHQRKFNFKSYWKDHFTKRPKTHLLLMQQGIAPRSMYYRYAFYGTIWIALVIGIIGLLTPWFLLKIIPFAYIGMTFIVGIRHYGFKRFFTWGLPLGMILTIGMLFRLLYIPPREERREYL
jgi:hypothetical protein